MIKMMLPQEQVVMTKEQYDYWKSQCDIAQKVMEEFDNNVKQEVKNQIEVATKEEKEKLKKQISENKWLGGLKLAVTYMFLVLLWRIIETIIFKS